MKRVNLLTFIIFRSFNDLGLWFFELVIQAKLAIQTLPFQFKDFMVYQIFPTQTLGFVHTDNFSQKFSDFLWGLVVVVLELLTIKYLFSLDLLAHHEGSGGSVRNFAEDHLEKYDPKRPDISLSDSIVTLSP